VNTKALIRLLAFAGGALLAQPQPACALEFQVLLDGRPLELHNFEEGAFGIYEMVKPIAVEIRTDFDVRWVVVRPLSSGIAATIAPDHHRVSFQAANGTPLTVEFNDDLGRVIHLFPYAPERHPVEHEAPRVRYFGPGVHVAGLITLKDDETLYLAPGAWVKGNVRSVGTRNVAIRGRGVLDGSLVPPFVKADDDVPGGRGFRNMIYLQDTLGATVEGITIVNSDFAWTVYLKGATGTRVDGVRILNQSMKHTNDGFDIVSSSDVVIQNIFVRTNDDCVVVKNLEDRDTHDITVQNAVLWNMPTGGNGLEVGFEMRNKPTHGVHFRNIDIIHVERGAAISIHNGDAATVSDITYDDIRVEDVRRKLFDFTVLYAQYGADRPESDAENSRWIDRGGTWDGMLGYPPGEEARHARFRGRIRDIRVTNLRVVDGALPYSIIAGFDPEHDVENVVIEGLEYLGRPLRDAREAKCVIENASGVSFR
jgi:hypothetical protein